MIEVKHLTFSYGKEPFIEDMNFDVKEGEIFGFLGPSGAGKNTLEKIIIGLIPGYQGSVTVGGIESNHHGKDFYENIGVDFEFSTMYEKMTARENLRFFASLYRGKSRNIDELLRQMALLDSAPFTNMGSVVEVFSDLTLWMKIKGTIQKININAND